MVGVLHGRLARALARHAGVRIFRFFERPLTAAGAPAAAPPGLQLRKLDASEAVALCADPELDLAPERVREAYARGDLCAGAFDGGRLAGYCWFAFSPAPHLDGVWVDFAPEVVWIYKSLVRPSHRGRGLAPALYSMAHKLRIGHARRKSLVCVEAHNAPSVRAALRSGHAPAGYAAYARHRNRLSTWHSPDARRHAVRFHLP